MRGRKDVETHITILLGGGVMVYAITQLGQPITLLPPQIHNTRTLTQTLIVCIQAQLDFIQEDFKIILYLV